MRLLAILLLATLSFSQQLPTNYANRGIDVTAYGAKGDRQQVSNAVAIACASAPCTVTSSSALFTSADTGKLFYLDTDVTGTSRVLPKGLSATTTCSGTAAIDTSMAARNVYVRYAYINANGTGRPGFEEFIVVPQDAVNKYCIKVTSPAAGGNTATNYVVEAAIDPGDPWVLNTVVALGYQIIDSNGNVETVTTAGTTNGTVPTWSTTYKGSTNDNTVVWRNDGHPVAGIASGTEKIQAACSSTAMASTCELDSITTSGSAITEPSVISGTVTYVNSTTITIDQTIPAAINGNFLTWGTDNRTPIINAVGGAAGANKHIYIPGGKYLVSCPGLVFTNPTFVGFDGEPAIGDTVLGAVAAPGTASSGNTVISTGGACPVMTLGTSGSQFFSGPYFANIAWSDVSGVGNATGGVLMYGNAGAIFMNNVWNNFSNGYGFKCDAGGTSLFCQFDTFYNPVMVNVKNGIIFTGGKTSENWITQGRFASSALGGGVAIDFQANGGSTTAGGSNKVYGTQALYFPITYHSEDQGVQVFLNARTEETFALSGTTNIAGGNGFGTGFYIDGNPSFAFCQYNSLDGSANFNYAGVVVTPGCSKFRVGNLYTETTTGPAGTTIDLPGTVNYSEFNTKDGLIINVGSSSTSFGIQPDGDTFVNSLSCVPGSSATCAINNGTSQTGVVMAIGTTNQSTGNIGQTKLATGNYTGTAAATIGDLTLQAGNSSTTDTASLSGGIAITAGGASAWATGGPENGHLTISRYFGVPPTNAQGDVLDFSTTSGKMQRCPTSCTDPEGVNVSTNGTATKVAVMGDATVNYDGTYTATAGWYACTSATTAGKVTPQVGACATGRQIGRFYIDQPSGTSGNIWIHRQ